MSANCHAASGLVDWSNVTLGLALPQGFSRQRTGFKPLGTIILRLRLLREALKKPRHNRPQRPLPEEPEDYSDSDSIWDDPALWMLMMH